MNSWVPILAGLLSGIVGYLTATFWYQPILRFRAIRLEVIADLVFYANVINAEGLNEEMQHRYGARIIANRRHAANLVAIIYELPRWYVWWLTKRNLQLGEAASELIGLSNTSDGTRADARIRRIQRFLGVNPPLDV